MENSRFLSNARNCLEEVKERSLDRQERAQLAIELAEYILLEARRTQTQREKKTQLQLAGMLRDTIGKAFITSLADQIFRSRSSRRAANQCIYLLDKYGVPTFMSTPKKIGLALFHTFGSVLPKLFVFLSQVILRRETSALIFPEEPKKLGKHLKKRRREGVYLNLNHLGEAILGEKEAEKRLKLYLEDLSNPEIEYISVKISTICSQINLLGWEETLLLLSERLKKLYRVAKAHYFTHPNGHKVQKFVNLDMEEYRDLHLTVELFKRTLDDSEFYQYSAGIVLQSYLPDAFLIQQVLTTWAMKRLSNGGAPIKIRIVKGANLAMEKVESSLRGWAQAPYPSKFEVDANFKRMLEYGSILEHAKAVHLGVASHNLFEIAYAMLLRAERGLERYMSFEMLEGMAEPIGRVVQKLTRNILLYCPVAKKEEFQNAVAYLVRRLDENTAPDNFLKYAFDIIPASQEWKNQAELFLNACEVIDAVPYLPRRKQNRFLLPERLHINYAFFNEPDTDWSLPQNRKWAETILREYSNKYFENIPLVCGKNEIFTEIDFGTGKDPSQPSKEIYRYALGHEKHLELCLETTEIGQQIWSSKPLKERLLLLDEIAFCLSQRRADLIGAMVADTGKTVAEADTEVSEAIDFARYYRKNVEEFYYIQDVDLAPKGPVLLTPPWNFPCSIPANGILAALAAGNSVVFKPAPEAVLVGWTLANVFWEAGVEKEVLQFFCCHDEPIGTLLVQDKRFAAVVLTGATSTAKEFLKIRPSLELYAETGGKNTIIVTAMADRDLAIKDILQSAFGHAGQKCSACSLLILEKELYNDTHFLEQLKDAARSLKVGEAWNLSTKVNPLIHPPNSILLRGLTVLEEGEEWLLKPERDQKNAQLWSPGIKMGVRPGSFTHQTELFGPVLGIMCAENLHEAIDLANGTPYGLTSGIHTLDEREQEAWKEKIMVGNCYINRGITGAIVRRQPFGGCKASSFGKGAKAGGPNYVLQLMKATQKHLPQEKEPWNAQVQQLDVQLSKQDWEEESLALWHASLNSYAFYYENYFSKDSDPSKILGQDNLFRYVPSHSSVCIQNKDALIDILRVMAAALTCGASLEISLTTQMMQKVNEQFTSEITAKIVFIEETEKQLIERIAAQQLKRLRTLSKPSRLLAQACATAGCSLIEEGVLANGRFELLHFLREVSLSIDYHRYGYLGVHKEIASPIKRGCGHQCRCC